MSEARTTPDGSTRRVDPELVLHVARQARGAAVGLLVAQIVVTAALWGDVRHRPLLIWLAACAVNDVRMFVANHLEIRRFTTVGHDRWYVLRNVLHGVLTASAWGALPVIAQRYGNDRGTMIALLVVLGVLSAIVYGAAASRLNFVITVAGATVPSILAMAMGWVEPAWFTALFLIFAAMLLILHRAVHRLVVEHVEATKQNRQLAEDLAEAMATADPVTSAKNRNGLTQWLSARAEPSDGISMLLAEINGLADIRWLLGHESGDRLMGEFARRAIELAGDDTVLGRVSDQAFALVSTNADRDLRPVFERTVASRFDVDGHPVAVSLNLGAERGTVESLEVDLAELAHAVRRQRPASDIAVRGRAPTDMELELLSSISAAIGAGEIGAWFQPLIKAATGRVCGWEALVRWRHPVHGMIPPDTLLPLAGAIGELSSITTRMLADSAAFVAALVAEGHGDAARIHVNVETSDLDGALLLEIDTLLDEYAIEPERLVLEVTERTVIHLDPEVRSVIDALRQRGVDIAIDDLGTGYSSLSHLLDLPADAVKIDRRFVGGLPDDQRSVALVRGLLGLADGLGYEVVAEGVETVAQQGLLDELGCDQYQGYLESPALPPADAAEWLRRRVPSERSDAASPTRPPATA